MPNFPTSLDSISNPTVTTRRNDPGFELHAVISTLNDIAELLEAKAGTSEAAPQDTPLANTVLGSSVSGKSKWRQIQAADIAPGNVTMLKIAEVTTVGSVATIDFTNIPQTYRHLMLLVSSRNDTAASLVNARFSSDGTTFDAGTNYDSQYVSFSGATSGPADSIGTTSAIVGAHSTLSNTMNPTRIMIEDYANTSYAKHALSDSGYKSGTGTGSLFRYVAAAWWRSASAVKGIRLLPNANNFAVGSVATLYGLPS